MTVIAWDGHSLAADRRSLDHRGRVLTLTKIFRAPGGELMAGTGESAVFHELKDWYLQGAKPEAFPTSARASVADLYVFSVSGVFWYGCSPFATKAVGPLSLLQTDRVQNRRFKGVKQMPTFAQLWANHPVIKGDTPLLDSAVYQNQCAINMSAALLRSGVDMRTYPGAKSWQKDKPKYAIRAEELANWLATGAAHLPTKLIKFAGEDVKSAFDKIDGKTGIIFLQDYYGPGLSGDHIDLFNKNRMTNLSSWFRIATGFSYEGRWSDYKKSKTIWLWDMK